MRALLEYFTIIVTTVAVTTLFREFELMPNMPLILPIAFGAGLGIFLGRLVNPKPYKIDKDN